MRQFALALFMLMISLGAVSSQPGHLSGSNDFSSWGETKKDMLNLGFTGQSSGGFEVNANIYPIGQVSSIKMVSLGDMKIDPIDISQLKFICDVMSSCGLYPTGPGDLKTGASVYPASQDDIKTGAGIYSSGQIRNGQMVYLDGVRSGATVSIIK
jgi:hypothetical protein